LFYQYYTCPFQKVNPCGAEFPVAEQKQQAYLF
jgi:hypothetical protein